MKIRTSRITPLIRVGERYQVTIPKEAREAIGLKVGDLVEARPGRGCIILSLTAARDKVEVAKRLAEADADLKAGRVHGPFNSVGEMLASLHEERPVKK